MRESITSDRLTLSAHLALPDPHNHEVQPQPFGLVLCHGFPVRGREAPASGLSFPELADRISATMGWTVLTFNYRGCGQSDGDFSLAGWRDDIVAAVDFLSEHRVEGIWLAGTGTGGSLCISAATLRPVVRGVVALAAQADFSDWASDPKRLLRHSRAIGVVTDENYPSDFDAWAAELKDVSPERDAAKLGVQRDNPMPLFLMHGDADDLVPSIDSRVLAEAHGFAELRIIAGGGHELRHDPRAVAILMGWLGRQQAIH